MAKKGKMIAGTVGMQQWGASPRPRRPAVPMSGSTVLAPARCWRCWLATFVTGVNRRPVVETEQSLEDLEHTSDVGSPVQ
jgi:hypothetical protein